MEIFWDENYDRLDEIAGGRGGGARWKTFPKIERVFFLLSTEEGRLRANERFFAVSRNYSSQT